MTPLISMALLATLSTALHAQEDSSVQLATERRATFPSSVLPHCLYGFDPHDPAIQPWPKGPVPDGYRLTPISKLHLLAQLGFEKDDLVITINGFALGTAERHFLARRGIQDAQTCRWEIRRGETALSVEATIQPGPEPTLVLERNKDGEAVELSREAVWGRLSNPYAFGRYPSAMAMSADDGVYAIDKGLVALMRDLDFEPLDHHHDIAGVALRGGRDVLDGLELMLTQKKVRWNYSRRGELRVRTFVLRGDVVQNVEDAEATAD